MNSQGLPLATAVRSPRYRPEIDGLRAFAVLAVIINHFNKDILPSGYLGVDIFFVISGYVITLSLVGRERLGFRDFLASFYERRIKRLLPALLLFVVVTAVLICLFNPNPKLSLRTGLYSLFGFSNLYLLGRATDYFAQSTELNPFTHTWSLGVEEQFYMLFPFLFWYSGFGRKKIGGLRNFTFIIAVLATGSLLAFVCLYSINQPAAYFLMFSRFWEMAAGCLVFLLLSHSKGIHGYLKVVPASLVLAGMLLVLFLPLSWAVVATILMVLLVSILLGCLRQGAFVYPILSSQSVVYIGLISYSLYLWHWGVLSISRWTIGIHWWSAPFQLALMFLLAAGSYHWLESPLRRADWGPQSWPLFRGFGAVAGAGVGLSVLMIFPKDLLFLGNVRASNGDDFSEFIPATREKCSASPLPSDCVVKPRLADARTIFLIGESHAGHLIPLMGRLHQRLGLGLLVSTIGSIPALVESTNEGVTVADSIREIELTNVVFADGVKQLQRGDLVVLSSRWEHHLFEDFFNREHRSRRRKFYADDLKPVSSSLVASLYLEKLESLVLEAKGRQLNVVIFAPLPVFRGVDQPPDAWACSREWFRPVVPESCGTNYSQGRQEILARVGAIRRSMHDLQRRHSNLFVYDVFDRLCPGQVCNATVGGLKMFRDDDHFSREGVLSLESHFVAFLKGNKLL